jgi:hypothetical protein
MDVAAAVARSRELLAQGSKRQAIEVLRERVTVEPESTEARRALADLYRELGHPDQAGRWGLLVPGYTTETERLLFARMIVAGRASSSRVSDLLKVESHAVVPQEFENLLAAERARAKHHAGPDEPSKLQIFAGSVFAMGILGTVVLAVIGNPADFNYIRACGVIGGLLVGADFVVKGISSLRERAWWHAVGNVALGVGIAFVAVAAGFLI